MRILKYKIEIMIFFTLFISTASIIALDIPHWNFLTFVIDYNTGFGGRKLIGSIMNLLLEGYVTKKDALLFILVFSIILLASLSLLIGAFIKKMKSYGHDFYIFSLYTSALYLFGPASILFLMNSSNMGRMDGFLIALLFLFIPFYINNKLKYTLTFAFSVISILIHPIFTCTYFPFYVALLVYDSFSQGVDKKKIVLSLCLCLTLLLFFCYVQLAPKDSMDINEAFAYLQSHTDYSIDKSSLYYEFYAPMNIHLKDWAIPNYPHSFTGLVLCLLFFSPVFVFFVVFWRICFKKAHSPLQKLTYWLMNASFLLMIPAFIVTVDFARWLAGYIICQFLLIGIILYKGDIPALEGSKMLYNKIKTYPITALLVLLYLSSFPKFTDMVYPGVIERIIGLLGIKYVTYF